MKYKMLFIKLLKDFISVFLSLIYIPMKHLIFTFLLLNLYCKGQSNKQIDLVLNHLHSQQKAWNEGNIDGFMSSYWNNDSLKFIGSKGITYGWQKTLDNYKKSYPNKEAMGKLNSRF